MKVSELEGAKLDYWVAKAEGHLFRSACLDGLREIRTNTPGQVLLGYFAIDESCEGFYQDEQMYAPSTDWSQGGPIIEREQMSFGHMGGGKYEALIYASRVYAGDTMLIAAMRCYVNYKFGDEVPDEMGDL